MKKTFLKTSKFTGKLIVIYIAGFLIAIISFAFLSKYMKTKQYSKFDKTEISEFDFSKYTFAGIDTIINVSEFKEKHVLVEFWFSGCKPCLSAMSSFPELADKNPEELVILSISIDDLDHMKQFIYTKRKEGDERFIKRPNWKFANIIANKNILTDLNIRTFPTYFILDKQGNIIERPHVMPNLEIKKMLSKGANLMDYIEAYHSVMPCGGLKKYLIAYSLAIFLPGLSLFILIVGIILIIRKFKKGRITNRENNNIAQ